MSKSSGKTRPDLTTLVGLPLGVGLILAGQAIEGGSFHSILQATAAFIVFGGTLGAVFVSFPLSDVIAAAKSLKQVLFDAGETPEAVIDRVLHLARRARREGLLKLEDEVEQLDDALLKKAMRLAVDGTNSKNLRETIEIDIASAEQRERQPARVYESAGGYSPTIGIIGAVLGLIHVMENLSDPSRLGEGIAVAFVATVYGVGAANLVFLPIANKLKMKAEQATRRRELVLEGVLAIQEGLNPWLIEQKLSGFVNRKPSERGAAREEKAA